MVDSERTALVEKAQAIVEHSSLNPDEKTLLLGRIPFAADVMLQMFVQVCEEDVSNINMVVRSLKRKLEAQGNLQKLHEIVKQERREIDELVMAS
jgi:hypothetical protein